MAKDDQVTFIGNIPKGAGDVIGICMFHNKVIIACQKVVYQLSYDNKLEKIKFIEPKP